MVDPTTIINIRSKESDRVVVRELPAPGPPGPPGDIPLSLEIELTLSRTFPSFHREIIYGPNDLQVLEVDTYDSLAKSILVFKKVLTYDVNNDVQTITTTHVPTGARLFKTIHRGPDGEFLSVDRVYTP